MTAAPEFSALYQLFSQVDIPPAIEIVAGHLLPSPYRELLNHAGHMTIALESYFNCEVAVQVLQSGPIDGDYARRILLTLANSQRIVQFGAVRIKMSALDANVSREILAENIPLGRILTNHNILTRVQPTQYFSLNADRQFALWFSVPIGTKLHGRLGVIYADDHPVIEVLEILAPVPQDLKAQGG